MGGYGGYGGEGSGGEGGVYGGGGGLADYLGRPDYLGRADCACVELPDTTSQNNLFLSRLRGVRREGRNIRYSATMYFRLI